MSWFKLLVGRFSLWRKRRKAMAAVRKNNRAADRLRKKIRKEREKFN